MISSSFFVLNCFERTHSMCRPALPLPIIRWLLAIGHLPKTYGNKKRRGSMYLSAPIPDFRPSHCP